MPLAWCHRSTTARSASARCPRSSALNTTLQDDYIADCAKGVDRWNRTLAEVGVELRLPHRGFNRAVGVFRDVHVSPDGQIVTDAEWAAKRRPWLPTPDDEAFVRLADAAGDRAREDGGLGRAAVGRHQRQAGRLRVRPRRLITRSGA